MQRLTQGSDPSVGGGGPPAWLFLAMGHARLGHGAEARQWLEKAEAPIDEVLQRKPWEVPPSWDWRLVLQRLRREAEGVLGVRR